MTVDFVYQLMQEISNKNQQGYFDPTQFNLFINQAQLSYMNYLIGQTQKYQPGRAVPTVQFGMNETVRQSLSVLIQAPSNLGMDASGFASYPADIQQVDAIYTTAMKRIRFVAQHKLASYLGSVIDPVSTNPIYTLENLGFRFYPNTNYNNVNLGSALLSYVKKPPAILWDSLPDVNGIPIYQPATSVDPVWYDSDMMEIMERALKMLGVNLQDQPVAQYADQLKVQGQ